MGLRGGLEFLWNCRQWVRSVGLACGISIVMSRSNISILGSCRSQLSLHLSAVNSHRQKVFVALIFSWREPKSPARMFLYSPQMLASMVVSRL